MIKKVKYFGIDKKSISGQIPLNSWGFLKLMEIFDKKKYFDSQNCRNTFFLLFLEKIDNDKKGKRGSFDKRCSKKHLPEQVQKKVPQRVSFSGFSAEKKLIPRNAKKLFLLFLAEIDNDKKVLAKKLSKYCFMLFLEKMDNDN